MIQILREYVKDNLKQHADDLVYDLEVDYDIQDGLVKPDSPVYIKYIVALDALTDSIVGILHEQVRLGLVL